MGLGGPLPRSLDRCSRGLSGVVMVDLTGEYWQAFSISWCCFAAGVAVWNVVPPTLFSRVLSRALLALSPAVLSCWGVHACRVNEQLAVMVEVKKAQGVGDEIGRAHV